MKNWFELKIERNREKQRKQMKGRWRERKG